MARRHPTSRRTPGDPDPGEDLFVARTLQVTEWAKEHSTLLIAMGIALALVLWGAIYYVGFQEERSAEATIRLEQIRQQAAMGDPQTATRELEIFVERFHGDPTALEGRILLGQLHLQAGRTSSAIGALEESFGGRVRRPLEIQGAFLLAAAYEEAGRWDDAEEIYLDVADDAEMTFQRRSALSGAARIRARQGAYEGAAELYGQILEGMSEDDPDRSLYQLRLGEMEAAAG